MCQAVADDHVPIAFVILMKPPKSGFIEGVQLELADIEQTANGCLRATNYVARVETMTKMYSKGQGRASMSKAYQGC